MDEVRERVCERKREREGNEGPTTPSWQWLVAGSNCYNGWCATSRNGGDVDCGSYWGMSERENCEKRK